MKNKNSSQKLKELYIISQKSIGWLVLSMIATIVSAGSNLYSIFFIKRMIDSLTDGKQALAIMDGLWLVVMLSLGIAAQYVMKFSSGKFSVSTMKRLRGSFLENVEHQKISSLERTYHTGDLLSRFQNDAHAVQEFFVHVFPNLIYYPCIFLLAFSYMLGLNWKLLVVSFIITPVFFFLVGWISRPMREIAGGFYQKLGEASRFQQDSMCGIPVIQSYGLEKQMKEKSDMLMKDALEDGLALEKRIALLQPMNIIMYEVPYLVCVVFGGYLAFQNEMSVGALIAFLQLLHYVIEPTAMFPRALASYRKTMPALQRMTELLQVESERTDGKEYADREEKDYIHFENVNFAYTLEQPVLKECSFTLEKGKLTALVGESGSGKSTILDLLCGFYEGYEGQIFLYGKELSEWSLEGIRRQLGIVMQDTYLFPVSVEENIRYAKPEASEKEIWEAARIANAHDFIMNLENGYQTCLSQGGQNLSYGQRQRVGIARAILKGAKILFLDEPLSAADQESEEEVMKGLREIAKQREVLLITHRSSILKIVDRILVLKEGRIEEDRG